MAVNYYYYLLLKTIYFINLLQLYLFEFINCLDFNIQDNAGNTPMHVAIDCDSYEALEFILSM